MFGKGNLGELIVSIGTDLTKLDKGLKTASTRISTASKRMSASLNQAGRSMTIFGAAVTAGFVAATIPAIKFEDAFAGVRKTVDASEEEFRKLEKNFLNLSKVIPTTATELARIGEVAGQLGVRGVENITKFTKVIAQIEASTSLTADVASVSFARIANIMDEPIANIDKMGSSVVALGNNFAANESEIINFTTRIAGAGKLAKLTTSDIFAIGTAFSAVGINAEAGGTSVQKVLNAMTEAVATGNEELKVFADVIGVTAEEFQRLYREDPSEVFTRFVEGLGKAGDESFKILEDLGMQNERVIRSFLSLAGAGDILRRTLETSGKAFKENTALQEEYDKRLKTTASQLKILKNNVTYAAIALGDTLLPTINKLIKDYLIPVVIKVAKWIEQNESLVKKIVLVTAAIGALALALGPLLIILGNAILVLGGIASAFTLLLSPLGLVLSGLGVFATAWLLNWRGIRDDTFNIIRMIKRDFRSLGRELTRASVGIGESLKNMWKGDLDVIQSVIDGWGKAGEVIEDLEEGHKHLDETVGANPGLDAFEAKLDGLVVKAGEYKSKFEDLFNAIESPEAVIADEEEKNEGDDKINEEKRKQREIEKTDVKTHLNWLGKLHKKYKNGLLTNEKEIAKTKKEINQSNFDQFKKILHAQAGESKIAAGILKALAIKEAIVNTAVAVSAALKVPPPPVGWAMAAITAALGAAEVATIAGVSFAEGTDSIPANVHPGEMIIPDTFADAIRKGRLTLSGEGGSGGRSISVHNTFDFENITITDERDIEELAEQLGDNIEDKIRSL